MSKSNINYAAVLAEAHKAASEAVDGQPDQYACGFAWVVIYGNDPLARYCRAQLKLQPGDDWKTRRYFGDRGYRLIANSARGQWCPRLIQET